MKDGKRAWGRGVAVLAVVALGAMTVAPAFSAKKAVTKKKAKKIATKQINKLVPDLVEEGIAEVVDVFGESFVRVVATPGADEATARDAAPEIPLFSKGPLSVYGLCFSEPGGPTVYGEVFIKTTAAGSVLDSDEDSLEGGPTALDFLNPGTDEVDRELFLSSVTTPGATFDGSGQDWHAMAPGGTSLNGELSLGVKGGDLAEGNGVYGTGDVCLFGGFGLGN